MAAWDAVHGRAQYYIQTGHPLNPALSKEVPSIGSVVCHELANQRRATDSLPAYISMNMSSNQAGLINKEYKGRKVEHKVSPYGKRFYNFIICTKPYFSNT